MHLKIKPIVTASELADVRGLFIAYGKWRNLDAALGDFEAELANLPGKYAQSQRGCLLIAYWKGNPAGCIAYQSLGSEICEMKRLWVKPEFQGNKIGFELVKQILEKGKNAGYKVMRLDTHPRMLRAQGLYRSFGFHEIGRYNDNPTPGISFFERKL